MSQQEQWRKINGFEGLYDVSDKGKIWSRKRNKILSPRMNTYGYYNVTLCKNGRKNDKIIHRLVAEHFIPNPRGLPEVNHINEQKTDNRVENLEWVSSAFNVEFSQAGYYVLYDPSDEPIEIYNLNKFARDTGLERGSLKMVFEGKRNSYKGFTRTPGVKLNRKRNKPVKLLSPDNESITFQSQKDAADYLGCNFKSINNLLKGKQKSCKGWTRAN